MIGRRVGRAVATLSLVVTGGCFATRSDMRVLQGDILNFRSETARADSRARAPDRHRRRLAQTSAS